MKEKVKVAVIGAAGRMGKRLIALISESEDLVLSGALEAKDHPLKGQDAGLTAGTVKSGVIITDSIAEALDGADAMIDFSTGNTIENAAYAVAKDIACVIGTTGLDENAKQQLAKFAEQGGRIVFSSNMSVGVNILFKLSYQLATVLGDEYDVEIIETHHRNKKDAPSGTALSLAEQICAGRKLSPGNALVHGRQGIVGPRNKDEVGIHAVRAGDVVGDHTIVFATEGERIELTHKASSRDTFAKGALRAVRFLRNAKPGLYSMQDVLGIR